MAPAGTRTGVLGVSVRRTALITGASAGLGESIALACAREGWQLALGARRMERLEAVAERARALGAEVAAKATQWLHGVVGGGTVSRCNEVSGETYRVR